MIVEAGEFQKQKVQDQFPSILLLHLTMFFVLFLLLL